MAIPYDHMTLEFCYCDVVAMVTSDNEFECCGESSM